ncbi:hypothetical protein O181_008447 [Austropuccinia psidii MF-1]|uniref:Uncharacterized protein n=1 Tax=Austropuccinia psidii MF-1 TaxID=1389203 RepID=A0A9Q3GJE3_9BASI|nr:hypothetical protein [Austropuccinia psidii MF-1]
MDPISKNDSSRSNHHQSTTTTLKSKLSIGSQSPLKAHLPISVQKSHQKNITHNLFLSSPQSLSNHNHYHQSSHLPLKNSHQPPATRDGISSSTSSSAPPISPPSLVKKSISLINSDSHLNHRSINHSSPKSAINSTFNHSGRHLDLQIINKTLRDRPSSSPRSKHVLMTKQEVMDIKQLADQVLLNTDHPQAQRLRELLTRLVNHAVALDEARHAGLLSSKRKIDTLNDYIHSLTLTKQSSSSRLELQSTEIDLLKRQALALSHKITTTPSALSCRLLSPTPSGIGKRKTDENHNPDLDRQSLTKYRNLIESQNKALSIENKTLESKLEQSEAQVQRLSKEFKKLRSLLVTGRIDLASAASLQEKNAIGELRDGSNHKSDSLSIESRQIFTQCHFLGNSPSPGYDRFERSTKSLPFKRRPTMGDAEAEHLLLASERLTSLSRSRTSANLGGPYQVSPSIKLVSHRSVDTLWPPKSLCSASLHARRRSAPIDTPNSPEQLDLPLGKTNGQAGCSPNLKVAGPVDEDEEENVLEQMIVPNRLTFNSTSQHPPKEAKKTKSDTEGKRVGLMNDLLAAAETVLTRSSSPVDANDDQVANANDDEHSRKKKFKLDHLNNTCLHEKTSLTSVEKEDSSVANTAVGVQAYSSGLDVLADQAFAKASQTKAQTALSPTSLSSSSLTPCSISPTYAPPSPHMSYSSDLSDAEPEDELERTTSPNSKAPSILPKPNRGRKREPGESAALARSMKKLRSPYVKWKAAEDALLVKAVSKYGQRWDAVSKCVPTRSYHQCRQRWLRGLKGGENLPHDLQNLYPAIQLALKVYQLSRRPLPSGQSKLENLDHKTLPESDTQSQSNLKSVLIGSDDCEQKASYDRQDDNQEKDKTKERDAILGIGAEENITSSNHKESHLEKTLSIHQTAE